MISKSQSFDVGCQKTQIEALDLLQGSIGHYVWNKLYKKTLFENITYPPGYIFEDWGTTYKTILKAKKIIYLDKILYYYCQHLGSISSTKSEKVLKDSHELKMQQFHSLADWGYPAKQLDTFLLNTALSYCIKKKKDLSDPDYVFCWNVLQACDSIPKGFNGNRKILFSLFKYCPALFEMICVIWGKKCCCI